MIYDQTGVLISCDPDFKALAVEELNALPSAQQSLHWLEDGLALAQTKQGFDAFAEEIRRAAPIFIRHIAPVERVVPLTATEADIQVLVGAAAELAGQLDPALTFSVQSRILGEGKLPYRRVVLNSAISTCLESKAGARMDCRFPEQIVSLLCTPEQGFLGVSRTGQNTSAWPGGMHRFKNEEGQISRSEHKLLEALSVFHLKLPSRGNALDMGAAPGGWTRVLRGGGLRVVAVDPADLDAGLKRDRGVVHVRKQIQAYLRERIQASGPEFEVLVNDMRMDAPASVEVMLQARACLKPGGLAVVTLKLPKEIGSARRALGTVRALISRLGGSYTILGARQLYHNRSEVTVALQG